jgi:catalase
MRWLQTSVQPGREAVLFEKTALALGPACKEVRDRHVANCTNADSAYGEGEV